MSTAKVHCRVHAHRNNKTDSEPIRNIDERSYNHFCSAKAISITYSDCVSVDLIIQHAMRMCHIVICNLSDSTVLFSMLSHQHMIYGKKVIELSMCLSSSSLETFSAKFLILRRTEWYMITNVIIMVLM
jgi:hypothetical protein